MSTLHMKIHLTPDALRPRAKATPKLPGEPRPFRERSSLRNLVPPQHLEGGTVTSGRPHEVRREDPLMQRIKELEAEIAMLRAQLEAK